MNIIGCLDRPTHGQYHLDGLDISTANASQLVTIRNQKIGFVFQTFNLIGRTSALKNVELPMFYAYVPQSKRTQHAKALLEMVGMEQRIKHQPNELSGGQKQRVAILLADEPTGALDSATSRTVMDLFHQLHRKRHMTIVLITHSQPLSEEAQRILTLSDGRIINERMGSKAGDHYG